MSMFIEAKTEMILLINLSIGSSKFKLSPEEVIEITGVLLKSMLDDCLSESHRNRFANMIAERLSNEMLIDTILHRKCNIAELRRVVQNAEAQNIKKME